MEVAFAQVRGAMTQRDEIRTVLCPATDSHPRHTEASILPFDDGRLLLAWSDFYADDWRDDAPARISAKWSRDEGESWLSPFVLQENIGRMNCMQASFLRQPNGRILFAFFRKDRSGELLLPMVRWSDDNATSWSAPFQMTDEDAYWCGTNDRLVLLSSGRILFPVVRYRNGEAPVVTCFLSDNGGLLWRQSRKGIVAPVGRGYAEPCVAECADGKLLMHIRTDFGNQHVAISEDGGDVWQMRKNRPPDMCGHPDSGPDSAESPCIVKRIPDTDALLMIWNNNRVRTPLTAAVSDDNGETWKNFRILEEMDSWPPRRTHTYPSLSFLRGNAHITYWEVPAFFPDRPVRFSLVYRRIPIDWLFG